MTEAKQEGGADEEREGGRGEKIRAIEIKGGSKDREDSLTIKAPQITCLL